MALNIQKNKKKLVAEINVVPYIDVMLVLLIVFMVAAPLLMQGVQVELPSADSTPIESKDQDPIIISIKADKKLFINLDADNGHREESLEKIKELVGKILRQEPQKPVLIWGDAAVPYGEVVRLMSELQKAGAPGVGLVTEPPQL